MGLKHTKVSAVADDPAADIKPSDWNADHEIDGDGVLITSDATIPSAPASGKVTLFGKTLAGAEMPSAISSSGPSYVFQPFFGQKRIAMWSPLPNSTTTAGAIFGIAAVNSLGTLTARAVATTNLFTTMCRAGYVSSASAANRAAGYTNANYWRGNAAGLGGFRAVFRFGISDAATVANANMFVGFSASSSVGSGSTEPSAALNIVGVGMDSTETVLSIMHNDGSGAATKVSLGADFPTNTLSTDVYELVLFAEPNGSVINYQVTRLNTGHVSTGVISTNLPVATQLMLAMFMRGNMSTALAVGVDIMGLYIETEG